MIFCNPKLVEINAFRWNWPAVCRQVNFILQVVYIIGHKSFQKGFSESSLRGRLIQIRFKTYETRFLNFRLLNRLLAQNDLLGLEKLLFEILGKEHTIYTLPITLN